MADDVLATQGPRTSTAMLLNMLSRDNFAPRVLKVNHNVIIWFHNHIWKYAFCNYMHLNIFVKQTWGHKPYKATCSLCCICTLSCENPRDPITDTACYITIFKSTQTSSIVLTHWGRGKMAAVSQTALSNAFSWMKMLEFQVKCHWSLFLRVQLTLFQHWLR